MKRFISVILTLSLALTVLAACSKESAETTESTTEETIHTLPNYDEEDAEEETTASEEEEIDQFYIYRNILRDQGYELADSYLDVSNLETASYYVGIDEGLISSCYCIDENSSCDLILTARKTNLDPNSQINGGIELLIINFEDEDEVLEVFESERERLYWAYGAPSTPGYSTYIYFDEIQEVYVRGGIYMNGTEFIWIHGYSRISEEDTLFAEMSQFLRIARLVQIGEN